MCDFIFICLARNTIGWTPCSAWFSTIKSLHVCAAFPSALGRIAHKVANHMLIQKCYKTDNETSVRAYVACEGIMVLYEGEWWGALRRLQSPQTAIAIRTSYTVDSRWRFSIQWWKAKRDRLLGLTASTNRGQNKRRKEILVILWLTTALP